MAKTRRGLKMKSLSDRQKQILEQLLDHPEGTTLDELAGRLGITNTAIKEHIVKLESLGYIHYTDATGSVGRPRRRYHLSQEAHEAFPKQYSWLSNVLLELLSEEMGTQGVGQLMKTLAEKVADSTKEKFKDVKNSGELITKLAETLSDLGYRASVKQKDVRKGAIIEATNCVYHSVAK